ncbi:hypothetical protein [Photobacterium sp. OFAV2-7]|uniref:hypothetical protein n=1 Tax=Photobacterium sp. OFAV2-7 TaxID=2917748 RepID=UPI001EF4D280|nr:hypothetical protein [Photobacterium sp. OFAV2-7]MCG7584797.1 hypothetical protein [Photobacterium sp. OFAV2-7]
MEAITSAHLRSSSALFSVVIKPLQRLLEHGSCLVNDPSLVALLTGIAHPCDDGRHWVISQRVLQLRQQLDDNAQLVAAILATDGRFRQQWIAIMAARCKEAAQLSDQLQLVERIIQLGGASDWVEQALDRSALEASSYPDIERELLGMTAEQVGAMPVLIRVLNVASQLSQWQQHSLSTLSAMSLDSERPDLDWVAGRLLSEPGSQTSQIRYLLPGSLAKFEQHQFEAIPRGEEKRRSEKVLPWVLASPWAFLLTAITYVQDIWQSEGLGGLLLELPEGQNPIRPHCIQVLILNRHGDEVRCGSLAEFIRRVLAHLSMGLFPGQMSDNELNAALAPVIELLLARQIWRYRDGLSGQLGSYQITTQFADACYRMVGQRAFALRGKNVREAIRTQALQWRREKQGQSTTNTALAE